jgi:hypothetical protein
MSSRTTAACLSGLFSALGCVAVACGGASSADHAPRVDASGDVATVPADAGANDADGAAVGTPDGALPEGALLVDDESSSTGQISLANGGYWYTYPYPLSGGSVIAPTPGTPFFFTPETGVGFSHAACVTATGITGFGAGMGFAFQLAASNGMSPPFDASAYSRISFYAMSPDAPAMQVTFADIGTYPYAPGATCAGGADAGPLPDGGYPTPPCGDSPQAAVPLTASWQQVTLAFAGVSAFASTTFYAPKSVDPSGLFYLTLGLNNPNARIDGGAPLSFHICVAQIYLLP